MVSDNHFSTVFGPSTPGALNLISGQTHGVRDYTAAGAPVATPAAGSSAVRQPVANGVGTVINDPDPEYDDCSNNSRAKTSNPSCMASHTNAAGT
jgi:phospholipase C